MGLVISPLAAASLPLPCLACRLPFAKVEGGQLVIRSRHNAEQHVNALSIEQVERLLEVMRGSTVTPSTV